MDDPFYDDGCIKDCSNCPFIFFQKNKNYTCKHKQVNMGKKPYYIGDKIGHVKVGIGTN